MNYGSRNLWRRNPANVPEGLEWTVDSVKSEWTPRQPDVSGRAVCSSTFIEEKDRTDAYYLSAGLRTSVGVARQKSVDGHTDREQPSQQYDPRPWTV